MEQKRVYEVPESELLELNLEEGLLYVTQKGAVTGCARKRVLTLKKTIT